MKMSISGGWPSCAGPAAAAHWLRVAAEVASDQSGIDASEVVRTADDIEALPHESPTLVLKALDGEPRRERL